MNSKRKLRIYYLDYNAVKFESRSRDPNKTRPEWFSYEVCLNNILYSVINSNSNFEIHFTLWYDAVDATEINLTESTQKLTPQLNNLGHTFQIITGDFKSGANSAKQLLEFLNQNKEFSDDDLIYVCENDYLHQIDWIKKVDELYTSQIEFDYVSLYDHRDNYTLPIHQEFNVKFHYTEHNIWRTGFSTCFSKISTLGVIKRDLSILLNYDDFLCFSLLKLFNRKLLISIPGLSTHAMTNFQSPAVNWDLIAQVNYK